jgi:signal transduction histidine kinase
MRTVFYGTFWFYVVVVVTGIFLLWVYVRFRLREIKNNNFLLERRIAERTREMESVIDELNHFKQALLERNLVQQRLLTAISHDIKSPLRFLEMVSRQYLEKLKAGEGDRTSSIRVASILQEGSYRLFLLTDNLLEYLKLYAHEGAITMEKVPLYSLVEEKRILFMDIAATSQNEILNRVPDDLCVKSDITLLRVILHNLLDNATKVTRDGQITIEGEAIIDQVSLTVKDTGPGMTESLVNWCNNRDAGSERMTIAGTGLLIVKELISLINGKLNVSSKPGNGTVIELILPKESCQ